MRFQKTQGLPEKNSSPILSQKLKAMESTSNFVLKTQGKLILFTSFYRGNGFFGQFYQQISRFPSLILKYRRLKNRFIKKIEGFWKKTQAFGKKTQLFGIK